MHLWGDFMFKRRKILSIALMSALSVNAAGSIINAKDEDTQISSVENQESIKSNSTKSKNLMYVNSALDTRYNDKNLEVPQNLKDEKLKKGISIAFGALKATSAITGVGLPIAAIKYDIKKYNKNFERKSLKQAIKDYEKACPETKKVFDELLSAQKLKELTDNMDQEVSKAIEKKIENAKKKLETIPKDEASAKVKWLDKKLNLEEAYKELATLTKDASEAEDTSLKIMIASSIHKVIHTLIN